MWGIDSSLLLICAIAGAVIASGLAFLGKSRTRTLLISLLAALPVFFGLSIFLSMWRETGVFDFFDLVLTLILIFQISVPWTILTLLPFNILRRLREIHDGIDYGTGN